MRSDHVGHRDLSGTGGDGGLHRLAADLTAIDALGRGATPTVPTEVWDTLERGLRRPDRASRFGDSER